MKVRGVKGQTKDGMWENSPVLFSDYSYRTSAHMMAQIILSKNKRRKLTFERHFRTTVLPRRE